MARIRSQNAKDLQITVQDCTLPGRSFEPIATTWIFFDSMILSWSDSNDFGPGVGHLDYDMKMAYQATLDRTFILQQVAKVLQEPEDSWWQCQTSLGIFCLLDLLIHVQFIRMSKSIRWHKYIKHNKAGFTDLRLMYKTGIHIIDT